MTPDNFIECFVRPRKTQNGCHGDRRWREKDLEYALKRKG